LARAGPMNRRPVSSARRPRRSSGARAEPSVPAAPLLPSRPRSSPSSAELRHLARPHFTGPFLCPRATASTAWATPAGHDDDPSSGAAGAASPSIRCGSLAGARAPQRRRAGLLPSTASSARGHDGGGLLRGACGGDGRGGLQRTRRRTGSPATSLRRRGGGSMAGAPDRSSPADPGGAARWAAEAKAEARGGVGTRRWRAQVGGRLRAGASARARRPDPAAGRSGGASGARRSGGRGRCTGRGAERRCEEPKPPGGGLGQRPRGAGRGEDGLGQPRPAADHWWLDRLPRFFLMTWHDVVLSFDP